MLAIQLRQFLANQSARWIIAVACLGTTSICLAGDRDPGTALPLSVTAQLLAGVDPDPNAVRANPRLARLLGTSAWLTHKAAAQSGDRQLQQRLARTRAWQSRHLPGAINTPTLIYPFSGPDLVNAAALFPDATCYAFFSLEPIGGVPDLLNLDDAALGALFSDLHVALNDLVALNFFITPNMKNHITGTPLEGSTPLLLAMIGLMGGHVETLDQTLPWLVSPESAGKEAARAVRIRFTLPGNPTVRELIYVALDVSDAALGHEPAFLPWLQSLGNQTVLLKSASYLLHGNHFRHLASTLLAQAPYIVQDDTGFPYHALLDASYQVTLYGQYEEPVKLFHERYQADLADAFARTPHPEPLPFPFGYNWRKGGKAGLMLAQRRSLAVAGRP
jgi:hypothetical protein